MPIIDDRPGSYDPDKIYGYNAGTGTWGWWLPEVLQATGASGGRYRNNIIVVGRKKIYFGEG